MTKILMVLIGMMFVAGNVQAKSGVTITGDKKGMCSPNMPMPKPKVPVVITLKAGPKGTFILNSPLVNLRLTAAAGKSVSQTVTFRSKGDYAFTCGDQSLPENKRTQGMFMAMDM